MMYRIVTILFAFLATETQAKFPINPKPCQYGDTNCIKDIMEFLFSQKFGGYSSLNLVPIDPLKIAAIDIKQGKESPVNIDLQFRNVELMGLKSSKVDTIEGFTKNLTQRSGAHLTIPLINLIADYTISGKILILPIQGTGRSNVTLENTGVSLSINALPQLLSDGIHMKIKSLRMTTVPKRVYFNFENLFNGNKQLGDTMNKFLNENWQDIYGEVQLSFDNAISQIIKSVINNVFHKYPYDKFFA